MRTSLSVLSVAAAISVFSSLGLTISTANLYAAERGSGRIGTEELDDRGSGRSPVAYRGSGRITQEDAYRGSGRLSA